MKNIYHIEMQNHQRLHPFGLPILLIADSNVSMSIVIYMKHFESFNEQNTFPFICNVSIEYFVSVSFIEITGSKNSEQYHWDPKIIIRVWLFRSIEDFVPMANEIINVIIC